MTAVEVDIPETWPAALRSAYDEVRLDLQAWKARERDIDELCQRDLTARFNPPKNKHQAVADQFAAEVDRILSSERLVCRHCTRLHRTDVERIRSEGMIPLTVGLTRTRLAELHAAGEIDEAELEVLHAKSQAGKSNRRDRTFWILGREPLRDFADVHRLLRSWGGEAMYWAHEDEPLGRKLETLGVAAIVEAAIPYGMLDPIWSVGELLRNALADGRTPEFTAVTRAPVPPDMIDAIVFHGSEAFEALTGASGWPMTL
jgi:hypothetical protein